MSYNVLRPTPYTIAVSRSSHCYLSGALTRLGTIQGRGARERARRISPLPERFEIMQERLTVRAREETFFFFRDLDLLKPLDRSVIDRNLKAIEDRLIVIALRKKDWLWQPTRRQNIA